MPESLKHDEEYLIAETNSMRSQQLQHADATASPQQTDVEIRRLSRRLYVSHALSTWNSRVFEFGAFLFLAHIFPQTLLPASVYALARAASAALFSPWLGSYIDRADRLRVVRQSILGQRLPVVVSCVGFLLMSIYTHLIQSTPGKTITLLILSSLACIEKLSAVLNTISVERDWVVVVAGSDESGLATMNAQMRRIDLFCKLVGPLAISFVDSYSTQLAILVTGTMSSVSVMVEYLAIARVYRSIPALRVAKVTSDEAPSPSPKNLSERFLDTAIILLSYFRHPSFLPSFALALLYLTALSFSGQFITYLLAQGLSSATIALFRGVAAIFEMSATWLGPWLNNRIGAVRSGIWFLSAELVFIALSCALLWLPASDSQASGMTLGLVLAVILSRTGLWGFDLSAQLLIQDEVEPDVRGSFSSLEASFQNTFEMLAFLSTVIFPRPEQFKYPAAMSAAAVASSALLYAYFVRARRGHLLHMSRCLDRKDRTRPHSQGWESIPLEEPHETSVEDEVR